MCSKLENNLWARNWAYPKSIILENSLKFWPNSQAEALAPELPIKKSVYSIRKWKLFLDPH